MAEDTATPAEDLQRIIESAKRLGVEMDEAEALQWLTAISVETPGDNVVVDLASGVYGHRITMMDFSPEDLERFREIGQLVGFEDRPGQVETALALSGSAAQSKIQTYPGDCDYFERVNIIAPTREEACRILAGIMRDKALATAAGPSYRLIEVKFGSYPEDLLRHGEPVSRGAPISWYLENLRVGRVACAREDGTLRTITWQEASQDPGWCKLDWVIGDPIRKQVANASNMLDVTWEAPDGTIVPLDGQLDPYFQEVYLEAGSIPIFSKVIRGQAADAVDDYVEQLEREIRKYVVDTPNYGKAAKRMYNVFRFTGQYQEAAYIRELFDEPATVLYQVSALVRTLEEAAQPGSGMPMEMLVGKADELIEAVESVVDDEEQKRSVLRPLSELRRELEETGDPTNAHVVEAEHAIRDLVNEYFHHRLTGFPPVQRYLERFA
ncbi:MAG: hypothetical protein M3245_01380 [Actinomycetota bacterium]|nr:hypothetical protein [Actinomycetota bacterium]